MPVGRSLRTVIVLAQALLLAGCAELLESPDYSTDTAINYLGGFLVLLFAYLAFAAASKAAPAKASAEKPPDLSKLFPTRQSRLNAIYYACGMLAFWLVVALVLPPFGNDPNPNRGASTFWAMALGSEKEVW